jgi:hypothetical protein
VILCSAQDPDSDYAGWNWGYHIYTDSDGYAVWEGMPGRPGGYRARLVDASARAYFWEATPGYTGDIDAKTLDFDTDETGVVHVNVHDSDGNPVANANVHAEFVQSGDVAQDNGGSEVYGSTDGSGLCDLSLRPTHQAMQVYAEVNGQVVYSDEFHVDVYGASVDVDVTLNP